MSDLAANCSDFLREEPCRTKIPETSRVDPERDHQIISQSSFHSFTLDHNLYLYPVYHYQSVALIIAIAVPDPSLSINIIT
jgi:hypothetical protein